MNLFLRVSSVRPKRTIATFVIANGGNHTTLTAGVSDNRQNRQHNESTVGKNWEEKRFKRLDLRFLEIQDLSYSKYNKQYPNFLVRLRDPVFMKLCFYETLPPARGARVTKVTTISRNLRSSRLKRTLKVKNRY
eukprot:sb/3474816/